MIDVFISPFVRRILKGYGTLLALFIMLPVLIMIPVSFGRGDALLLPPPALSLEWYRSLIENPRWWRAIVLSFQVALVASLIATVLGVAAALAIGRLPPKLQKAMKYLFIAPMIVPTMVIGVGFYIVFANMGLLGKPFPLSLAHAIVVIPFVVLPVTARMVSLDPWLEKAASSLGAGPYQVLWRVSLPLLLPAIIAAAIFAFIFSFDEVVLAQLLSGPRFETLPRRVWEGISQGGLDKTISAIATIQFILILLAVGAVALVRKWRAGVAARYENEVGKELSIVTAGHEEKAEKSMVAPGKLASPNVQPDFGANADEQHGVGIRFENLTKRYGNFVAVDNVNLEIHPGEFVTILGPSGSGKTSLLMLLAGFVAPDSGSIMLGDRDVARTPPYQRDIGVVFQSYALFPHMNVQRNVGFPLNVRGVPRAKVDERVKWALSRVHMSAFAERRANQLSGGQQQRVALARAISFAPRALLMDEPLAALDRNLRGEMQREIRALQQSLGQTVVFVTHDQEEALSMSDRIAVMNHGQLLQLASPKELYMAPRNSFVASFFGEANLLSGVAQGDVLSIEGASIPLSEKKTGKAVLCVRPEVIQLHARKPKAPWAIEATVTDVRFLGSVLRVELTSSVGPMVSVRQIDTMIEPPVPGSKVYLHWDVKMAHVMDD